MLQFAYVVLSNPIPGREDEYNDWYTHTHLAEVLTVPGFVSAQRFRLSDDTAQDAPRQRYMAIYTIKTDNPDVAISQLMAFAQSGKMAMSDALSMEDVGVHLYEAITPVVDAAAKSA